METEKAARNPTGAEVRAAWKRFADGEVISSMLLCHEIHEYLAIDDVRQTRCPVSCSTIELPWHVTAIFLQDYPHPRQRQTRRKPSNCRDRRSCVGHLGLYVHSVAASIPHSSIEGHDDEHLVEDVRIENLRIDESVIGTAEESRFRIGDHARKVRFHIE